MPDPKPLGGREFGDGDGEYDGDASVDIVSVVDVTEGSQLNPGLTTIFKVSPSLTLYSFKSFPS